MEIPTVKMGLYEENPFNFSLELGGALENFGVAQVDGLKQDLVDDLYRYMSENAEDFEILDKIYLGRNFYKKSYFDNFAGIKSHVLRCIPRLMNLKNNINKNIAEVSGIVTNSVSALYGKIANPNNLYLLRYYQKAGLFFPEEKYMIKKHTDEFPLVFAPSASQPGLEGKIKGRWESLEPKKGHMLVMPGEVLEYKSDFKIKALDHRVQYPAASERWALVYA